MCERWCSLRRRPMGGRVGWWRGGGWGTRWKRGLRRAEGVLIPPRNRTNQTCTKVSHFASHERASLTLHSKPSTIGLPYLATRCCGVFVRLWPASLPTTIRCCSSALRLAIPSYYSEITFRPPWLNNRLSYQPSEGFVAAVRWFVWSKRHYLALIRSIENP